MEIEKIKKVMFSLEDDMSFQMLLNDVMRLKSESLGVYDVDFYGDDMIVKMSVEKCESFQKRYPEWIVEIEDVEKVILLEEDFNTASLKELVSLVPFDDVNDLDVEIEF